MTDKKTKIISAFMGGGFPVSQEPPQEGEKKETKEQFASRLTKAFMDADPDRRRISKRRRRKTRKAIYKIIINEINRSPNDKGGKSVPPQQPGLPYIG